ncbi:MAG: sugar phosphate nucleotidyltransferase [Candidatus Binatia bacterium]
MELEHEWAVILAGGDGTRLKSLSRKITGDERPKQFCPVFGDMTLLEETQRRVAIELAKERTLFVVNRHHEPYEAGPRIHPNGRRSTALDGILLKAFGSQRRLDGP